MNYVYRFLITLVSLFLLSACSGGGDDTTQENFLDDQVQAIDKAKEIEGKLKNNLQERMKGTEH